MSSINHPIAAEASSGVASPLRRLRRAIGWLVFNSDIEPTEFFGFPINSLGWIVASVLHNTLLQDALIFTVLARWLEMWQLGAWATVNLLVHALSYWVPPLRRLAILSYGAFFGFLCGAGIAVHPFAPHGFYTGALACAACWIFLRLRHGHQIRMRW